MHKIVQRYIKSIGKAFSDAYLCVGTSVKKNVSGVSRHLSTLYERRRCCQYNVGRCLGTPDTMNIALCFKSTSIIQKL